MKARQALRALKGIVKLQALVRGHNVRKQAKAALKCMQALIRVQAEMRDQCSRPLQHGTRRSMFAETNNLWDKYKDIRERNSMVRPFTLFLAVLARLFTKKPTFSGVRFLYRQRTRAALWIRGKIGYIQ